MSRPLGVALVGLGKWGRNLQRVLLGNPRVRLAALVDPAPGAAGAGGAAPATAARFTELGQAIASVRLDAVVIASPPQTHAALAALALQAGLHTLVEKPLATCSRDAQRLVDLARAGDRVLMVGHVLQHHASIEDLTRRASKGQFGALLHFQSQRWGMRGAGDPWWTLAPHDLALATGLLGDPVALAAQRLQDGSILAELSYADCRARLSVRGGGEKRRRFELVASRAHVRFDDLADCKLELLPSPPTGLRGLPESLPTGLHSTLQANAPRSPLPEEPLAREVERFVAAALDGAPPITDGQQGLRVVRLLEAGGWSLQRDGAVVPLRAAPPAPARPPALLDGPG